VWVVLVDHQFHKGVDLVLTVAKFHVLPEKLRYRRLSFEERVLQAHHSLHEPCYALALWRAWVFKLVEAPDP
jgi:hypothetical protein